MDPGEYVLIPDGEHMVVLRSGASRTSLNRIFWFGETPSSILYS